jgi:hypothetical protein
MKSDDLTQDEDAKLMKSDDLTQDIATLFVWEEIARFLKTCPNAERDTLVDQTVVSAMSNVSNLADHRKLKQEAIKAYDFVSRRSIKRE